MFSTLHADSIDRAKDLKGVTGSGLRFSARSSSLNPEVRLTPSPLVLAFPPRNPLHCLFFFILDCYRAIIAPLVKNCTWSYQSLLGGVLSRSLCPRHKQHTHTRGWMPARDLPTFQHPPFITQKTHWRWRAHKRLFKLSS